MKPQWMWNESEQAYGFYYRDCDVEKLINALKLIDTLSDGRGSQVSWKSIYEECQTIARKALEVTP
jgi:hypothetical protein